MDSRRVANPCELESARHRTPAGTQPRSGTPAGSRRSPGLRARSSPTPTRIASHPGTAPPQRRRACARPLRGGSRMPSPRFRATDLRVVPDACPRRIAPGSGAVPAPQPFGQNRTRRHRSHRCSASIWYPPQMPSTGRPAAARESTAWSRPRERIHSRSDNVARDPGSTTRSARATTSGSAVTRTSTPGSAANASTSVALETLGNRTTATESVV